MYCRKCGTQNKKNSKFCNDCGIELIGLSRKTTKRKRAAGASRSNPNYFYIAIGIIITSFIIVVLITNDQKKSEIPPPIFSASAHEVASKFYCPCGACDKSSLDTCMCDNIRGGVVKMREIEFELASGKSSQQVIDNFNKKYKSIKPEFAHLISNK